MEFSLRRMNIEPVSAVSAIDWSPHHHAFVNPYNGCSSGCPFCFWLSKEGWEGRIQVRENIANLLDKELSGFKKGEYIYLGSLCDPFMEIEREKRLTRDCLEVIRAHETPLLITSSATTDVIREYIDFFRSMNQRVIIVVELSRIKEVEKFNCIGRHRGIDNANYLVSKGLEVWATVSPVLPGVTDISSILKSLDERIPVYIDSLQCVPGSIQSRKIMDWIKRDHQELQELYYNIIEMGDRSYFDQVVKELADEPRIKRFPYNI